MFHKLTATRLAPARIWLGPDCINDPIEGDRRVPGRLWPVSDWESRALALAPANTRLLVGDQARPSTRDELDWRTLSDEVRAVPVSAFMSLTPLLGQHQIRLIHFGVEIEPFSEPLAGASTGLTSLISTRGLVLDATGCKAVDDEAFRASREQLRAAYSDLHRYFQQTAAHTNIQRIFKGY